MKKTTLFTAAVALMLSATSAFAADLITNFPEEVPVPPEAAEPAPAAPTHLGGVAISPYGGVGIERINKRLTYTDPQFAATQYDWAATTINANAGILVAPITKREQRFALAGFGEVGAFKTLGASDVKFDGPFCACAEPQFEATAWGITGAIGPAFLIKDAFAKGDLLTVKVGGKLRYMEMEFTNLRSGAKSTGDQWFGGVMASAGYQLADSRLGAEVFASWETNLRKHNSGRDGGAEIFAYGARMTASWHKPTDLSVDYTDQLPQLAAYTAEQQAFSPVVTKNF